MRHPSGRPRIGSERAALCACGGAARAPAAAVRTHTQGRHRQSAARACHGVRSAGWLTDAGLERLCQGEQRPRQPRVVHLRKQSISQDVPPSRQPGADFGTITNTGQRTGLPALVCNTRGRRASARLLTGPPAHRCTQCKTAATRPHGRRVRVPAKGVLHGVRPNPGLSRLPGTSRPRLRCRGLTPSRAHALTLSQCTCTGTR